MSAITRPPYSADAMSGCVKPNTMKPNATNGRSYLSAWADYISLWIDSYEASGIPIWGLTPQNEPDCKYKSAVLSGR